MAAQGAVTAVHQYGHADGGALVPGGGGEMATGGVSAEDRARLFRKYELPPFLPGTISSTASNLADISMLQLRTEHTRAGTDAGGSAGLLSFNQNSALSPVLAYLARRNSL
jgi:hypothetical protein